jgi:hypothetical protein
LQIQENILLHHQNSNFKKIQEKRAGNNHLPETEYQRERERERDGERQRRRRRRRRRSDRDEKEKSV